MAKVGGETNQMRELAKAFETSAPLIQQVLSKLDPLVQSVDWEGGAARRFQDEWNTDYKTKLRSFESLLTASAKEVRDRATALDAAGGT